MKKICAFVLVGTLLLGGCSKDSTSKSEALTGKLELALHMCFYNIIVLFC